MVHGEFNGLFSWLKNSLAGLHLVPILSRSAPGPYPEPDKPSSHPSTLFLSDKPFRWYQSLQSDLPSGFPTKILYMFLYPPKSSTGPAHLILLDKEVDTSKLKYLWCLPTLIILLYGGNQGGRIWIKWNLGWVQEVHKNILPDFHERPTSVKSFSFQTEQLFLFNTYS